MKTALVNVVNTTLHPSLKTTIQIKDIEQYIVYKLKFFFKLAPVKITITWERNLIPTG